MRIAVFGLGYVGTVTAAGLASRGHEVRGVDVDPVKVGRIRAGRSPVVEPGLDELVADGVFSGALRATTDAVEASTARTCPCSVSAHRPPSTAAQTWATCAARSRTSGPRWRWPRRRPPDSTPSSSAAPSRPAPGTRSSRPIFADLPADAGWQIGTAMCPEFLREGSGVADFFDPPFVVAGAADPRVHDVLTGMFAFLGRELRHVDVRSAEALKYACNAFHATKVSFANEMGRVFRAYGVDAREVMRIFCEDRILNISPAYLQPGFAFGGSCLPKDLRALLHMARANDLDVPLLAGTLRSNELVVRDVLDRIVATPARVVAMLGLSFKSDTDDLRESPYVELAERLLGKGFEVRIYDPIINPQRLTGANLRYVEARLPHLGRLLSATPQEALRGSDTAVVATSEPAVLHALRAAPPPHIVDLSGRLGAEVERIAGYEGLGWTA